jgi:lysozyme
MGDYLILAIDLIKRFEGYSSEPYQDPTGTWTIGYGFTGPNITAKSPPMTQEQADDLLGTKLISLNQLLDTECFEPLTNHQRAALLSLGWNIGMGRLGRSTLMAQLNNGAYGVAAAQFLVFTFSKGVQLSGLTARREAEMACFNTADVS